jgi:molybdopterin molybdotransferase
MITVQEAENIIFQHILSLNTEGVSLVKANGRILAENLYADRDFPPFDRVTMDGIAIQFADFQRGIRDFDIIGVQAAGAPQVQRNVVPLSTTTEYRSVAQCYEIMTGAMLPEGFDTVIRYEDLKIENGVAKILIDSVLERQNIHKKGIDRRQNDTLILRGCKITASEIATAATVGKSILQVVKNPKIAIISTGDELVEIDQMPLPHQIRRSNVYAVAAILEKEFNITSKLFHFMDDKDLIFNGLKKIVHNFDIVILSGAVSEGKFDFVPEALDELGVEKLFHKVAQRPGKPFWFGIKHRKTTSEIPKTVIFALPGNPVSTFMCAYRYIVPFIQKSIGLDVAPQYARLMTDFSFKPALTYFLQVKLKYNTEGVLEATPIEGHGSGDLANLNDADAFLELPMERDTFKKGETYKIIPFR